MPGHAGFDSSGYPGDKTVIWLKKNTNLEWCGFYLGPTPSHPGTSWMGKRSFLVKGGWGLAPLYVGQQTVKPGSRHSNAHQGYIDGDEAVKLMTDAGFPIGSCVYLDLENGRPFPREQKAYVSAWVDQVEHNSFATGVYCSHTFAAELHQVVDSARIWVFKVTKTAPHPVPGPHYPDNHPGGGSGYAGAYAWQLGQNCKISVPGAPRGRIMVDLDSAVSTDPGAPPTELIAGATTTSRLESGTGRHRRRS